MSVEESEKSLLPLVLRKSKSASAEAKRHDMENFFMANTKADAEGEKVSCVCVCCSVLQCVAVCCSIMADRKADD